MARNALTAVNAQERANTIPRLHKAKTVACGLVKEGKRVWSIVAHSVTQGWQDIFFLLGCMGYKATHTTSDGKRVLPLCIEGGNIVDSKTSPRSLSEKEPVYESIVAVSRVKGDNDSSLLWSLLSRRHAEITDERALQENVSALGAPALPA